jgi:hypothetical protein
MSAAAVRTPVCAGSENGTDVVKGTTQTTQAEPAEDSRGPLERINGSTRPSTHHRAPKLTTTRTNIATPRHIRATLPRASVIDREAEGIGFAHSVKPAARHRRCAITCTG